MDFTALKAELAARGFDQLSAARQGQFINAARQELDNRYLWPWLEKTASGPAPLTITDLGVIETVVNTTVNSYTLSPASRPSLKELYGDLTIAGLPIAFYVDWTTGTPRVLTFPTSTNSITVQYWKRSTDLSSGTDTPLAPADYHMLIVDMAVQRAYMDGDNLGQAAQLAQQVEARIAMLANRVLGGQQIAGPGDVYSLSDGSVDS